VQVAGAHNYRLVHSIVRQVRIFTLCKWCRLENSQQILSLVLPFIYAQKTAMEGKKVEDLRRVFVRGPLSLSLLCAIT